MSSLGKWSKQGVPKKGWICIGLEDLGEPATECEMCENQEIRYVHQMQHPNYPDILDCGCVCAGKLEENYAAASKRESDSKNLAQRRARWLTRKWKVSTNGNDYLKTDGFHIVVFSNPGGWMEPSPIWPPESQPRPAVSTRPRIRQSLEHLTE